MKTKSGAKKRFKLTGTGKVKRKHASRRHNMSSKNHKAKRHLAKGTDVHSANMGQMERLLVY